MKGSYTYGWNANGVYYLELEITDQYADFSCMSDRFSGGGGKVEIYESDYEDGKLILGKVIKRISDTYYPILPIDYEYCGYCESENEWPAKKCVATQYAYGYRFFLRSDGIYYETEDSSGYPRRRKIPDEIIQNKIIEVDKFAELVSPRKLEIDNGHKKYINLTPIFAVYTYGFKFYLHNNMVCCCNEDCYFENLPDKIIENGCVSFENFSSFMFDNYNVKVKMEYGDTKNTDISILLKYKDLPDDINYTSDGFGISSGTLIKYSGNATNVTIPDCVDIIADNAFSYCKQLVNVIIPDSVRVIGNAAFMECSDLESVIMGDSITEIGIAAFRECRRLNEVIIPNSVTEIREQAFLFCESLNKISFSYGLKAIEENAFGACKKLINIHIPDSVTNICINAFGNCTGLRSITVSKGNSIYDSRNNCNAIIETKTNKLLIACNNTIIPDSVTSIGSEAFYNCENLTSITIPDSVTSIGEYAFGYCEMLDDIYYTGTKSDRNSIEIELGNGRLINSTWHYSILSKIQNTVIRNNCSNISEKTGFFSKIVSFFSRLFGSDKTTL